MNNVVLRIYWWLPVLCLLLPARFLTQTDDAWSFKAGLLGKKMYGFYWCNGVTAEFQSTVLLSNRLLTGVNFSSSSLGTAFGSNALPLHLSEVYAQWLWRNDRKFRVNAGINTGWAFTDYGHVKYSDIPSNQPLLSLEGGISYVFTQPLSFSCSLGYNLLTGNGKRYLGLVYPLYFNFKLLWCFRQ